MAVGWPAGQVGLGGCYTDSERHLALPLGVLGTGLKFDWGPGKTQLD